jgi:hypothetical protein
MSRLASLMRPQPLDLAPDDVGERFLIGGLAAQEVVPTGEEVAVPPVCLEEAGRIGAVQLQHARGHVLQEIPVVADDDDGADPLGEDALEPEDAFHVEVVGGLVHQQHVGRGRQRPRDRQALFPAAGQRVDIRAPVGEAGAAQRDRDAARPVALVHPWQGLGDDVLDGDAGRKDRVLGDVADADATADGARAVVGRLQPRQDLEKGGLAGAIGTDETGLVAFEEPERELFEERPGPVGLADRLTAEEQRPGHPALLLLLRLLLFLLHAHALRHALTPLPRMIIPFPRVA